MSVNEQFSDTSHEEQPILVANPIMLVLLEVPAQKRACKYTCEPCSYVTDKRTHWNRHASTDKHKRLIDNSVASGVAYHCDGCGYKTTRRNNWNSHLLTTKHNTVYTKNEDSFSQHDMIRTIVDDNKELRLMMSKLIEQNSLALTTAIECSKRSVTVFNSNNINNNNFNINVFLNEKCANAKNMSDFIAGIEITHEDLENNAELGFVGGMVKIITDNLNKLDITERPIHCTDSKRDILYIKDDNKWSKEGSFDKMNKYIQEISGKNVRKLLKWKRENPDYADGDSEFSIKSLKIHMTLMAGAERDKFYPRVIHEVSKLSIIDKNAA